MPVCDAHVLERLRLLDGSQSWWPRPRADRSAHIIVGRGRGKGDVETVVREALREARTAACERRSLRVEANGQLVRAHRRLKQIFGVARWWSWFHCPFFNFDTLFYLINYTITQMTCVAIARGFWFGRRTCFGIDLNGRIHIGSTKR